MAMGAASIGLLMVVVSLEAQLLVVAAAGTSAAAVSGGTSTTIRLPSDGIGLGDDDDARRQVVAAAAVVADDKRKGGDAGGGGGTEERRPWECCDFGICTVSMPPICHCMDQVDRCSDACKECEETEDAHHVCHDAYGGDPGPRCHEEASAAAAVLANDRKKNAGGGGGSGKRPWKCCDVPICTRSFPPVCRCADTVERCASTCQHCEQVEEAASGSGGRRRYRCLDTHQGDPGPSCGAGEDDDAGGDDRDWARRLARGHAPWF